METIEKIIVEPKNDLSFLVLQCPQYSRILYKDIQLRVPSNEACVVELVTSPKTMLEDVVTDLIDRGYVPLGIPYLLGLIEVAPKTWELDKQVMALDFANLFVRDMGECVLCIETGQSVKDIDFYPIGCPMQPHEFYFPVTSKAAL